MSNKEKLSGKDNLRDSLADLVQIITLVVLIGGVVALVFLYEQRCS